VLFLTCWPEPGVYCGGKEFEGVIIFANVGYHVGAGPRSIGRWKKRLNFQLPVADPGGGFGVVLRDDA